MKQLAAGVEGESWMATTLHPCEPDPMLILAPDSGAWLPDLF